MAAHGVFFPARARRFRRASLAKGSPRASASRITALTDKFAASASALSVTTVAGSTLSSTAPSSDSRGASFGLYM